MFTTPKKPRGAYTAHTPSSSSANGKVRLRGLFMDGIWHCNCEPRMPASHFQVKKDGPNKGKWFYTCQEPKDSSCGFFLWDDKAAGREMQAVINNARSEPGALRTPADAARDKSTFGRPSGATTKFMADLAKAQDAEYDFTLSQEEERNLVKAVEEADAAESPDTPRKAIKTSEFSTPGSKRKREEEMLPTPISGAIKSNVELGTIRKDDDVFQTPNSRPKGGMFDRNERMGLRSPSATPTPSRFHDITTISESASPRAPQNYDISDEVLDMLKDQPIDEETISNLRTLLSKHAAKVSGIVKGRDITRVALKAKDAKITELQDKIVTLEAARQMDKECLRRIKGDVAGNVEKRRGRGRGKT